MAEQWYWSHKGEVIGPLSTAELEQLIEHNRIFDRDQVQLVGKDVWLSGGEIKALFDERSESSTAEAAARLLDQAARRQFHRHVDGPTEFVMPALRRVSRFSAALGEGLLEGLSHGFTWILVPIAPLFNRKLIAVVLGLLVVAIVLSQMDFGGSENHRIYADLTAAHERMRQLRPADEATSSQQWQEFVSETTTWLDPTIKSLEEAIRQHPVNSPRWLGSKNISLARVSLLDAARALRSMLDDGAANGPHRWQFEQGMGGANHFITGKSDPRYPSRNERYSLHDVGRSFDATAIALATAGIGALGCGILYWLKRRRG